MVGARHGQAPDVERLPDPPVLGDPVDAAEVQRLVPDVELLQAGQAGPDHDVAFGPGLESAAPAQIEDAVEHVARLAPHELQAFVGAVEVLLLRLQLGMFGHRSPSSPRPASCCRVPSGKRSSLERDGPGPGLAPRDPAWRGGPGTRVVAPYDERAMRIDTTTFDLGDTWTDICWTGICADGTAVVVEPLG